MPAVKQRSRNRDPYPNAEYKEGVFLGYRAVEHFGVQPMFPFGYGLSYGSFQYGNASLEAQPHSYKVSFTVKNVSKVRAAVVPQVYVSAVSHKLPRPDKELKGYDKLWLNPGEQQTVSITLTPESFGHYSVQEHDWVVDQGHYRILIGNSSSDIKAELEIEI